ncbi:MAG: hypothetical protein KDD35_02455 [Bdellovibrionales bacterium]|nr:hypothetical protein [Bdellovibrionales bacterium]
MLNQLGTSKTDTIIKLVLIFFISLLSFSVGTFVGKQVSDSDYKRAALEDDYKSFRQASQNDHSQEHSEADISDEELTSLTEEFVHTEKEKLAKEEQGKRAVASLDGHESEHHEGKQDTKLEKDGYKKYAKAQPSKEFMEREEEKVAKLDEYRKKLPAVEPHQKNIANEGHGNSHAHGTSESSSPASTSSPEVTKEAQRVAEGKSPSPDPKQVRQPTSILPSVATSTIGKYTVQVASYALEEEAKAHAS